MGTRLELHNRLVSIMKSVDPSLADHVYFQPPSNIKIKYPCIVYNKNYGDTKYADDNPYIYHVRYQITVIDKNPDSKIPRLIAMMPMCSSDRCYVSDNLNHDVFNIYY